MKVGMLTLKYFTVTVSNIDLVKRWTVVDTFVFSCEGSFLYYLCRITGQFNHIVGNIVPS